MNTRGVIALITAFFLHNEGKGQETTTIYPSADMWMGNTYNTTAQNNQFIRIGGWGDRYFGFLKFDWESISSDQEVEEVHLHLPPDKNINQSVSLLSSTTIWLLSTAWNERTSRINDPLRGWNCGSFNLSKDNGVVLDITGLYEYWVLEDEPNHGILLYPDQNNNKWFYFPSRESGANNRPKVVVYYKQSIPDFKLPLPGGKEWKLTTRIGENLPSHSGMNYYSVDFGPTSRVNGKVKNEANVRIYAAAAGVVYDVDYKPRMGAEHTNGNYVIIDHDGDGNISTGFQTRYLHLAYDPRQPGPVGPGLSKGTKVKQGQFIGILGRTGTDADHLHFGVRYKNDGSKSGTAGEMLGRVRVDGRLLKNFSVGKYYQSTNTH